MYFEPLLLVSMVLAATATWSQNSRIARFGLGFYALFSSLVIYDIGEAMSALVYLFVLGIVLTAIAAYVEVRIGKLKCNNCERRSTISFALITAVVFLVSYLVLRQFVYAAPISIVCMGILALPRRNLLSSVIGVSIIESALLMISAEIGLFTRATSIPLCLLMLASSLGVPYLMFSRGNRIRPAGSS